MSETGTAHRVCSLADLADAAALKVQVDGHGVCLVRIGGDVYAIGDRCSHADVSLSEGEVDVDACEIECVRHGSAFSLTTGEPSTLPATQPVPVYEVMVKGDDVMVVIS
jgi:3-phenylpropionate/trans-cinnamate dioxygenase ferredoxin component